MRPPLHDTRGVRICKVDISDPAVQIAIKTLHDECYPPPDSPYTPTTGDWWVAFEHGHAVAFAGISTCLNHGNSGYLCRAGVIPRARGRGLQKKLIRKRLAFARKKGWSQVVTDTHKNPASANSLISCGFRMYRPEFPWSFTTACYWRKSLVS